jgi:acetyl-CoA carboxylase biotin carboxyl carrier protein
VGDPVAKGGTVLIMESMKMEIPLEATQDGTIAEIRCKEGQPVQEGDILVVLK